MNWSILSDPQVQSGLRSFLLVFGAYAVGQGWLDSVALDLFVGGLVAAIAGWGIRQKQATSTEARKIAGKVEAHPTAEPIAPKETP